MSRSIHDTRRFLFEALHDDFADPELQDELVRTARHNLRQQRSIKRHVRQQRRQRDVVLPPLDVDRLPIVSVDDGVQVGPVVLEEDLRAVMRRLPPGSLDGLYAIELFAGSPGAGSYVKESRTIRLSSHVKSKDAPDVLSIVLKLRALVAFLREGARHFDTLFRVGGSRWRTDDVVKNDVYAARKAASDARRYVIPYLQERYESDCQALAQWMQQHGGVALPLALFLDKRLSRESASWRALRAVRSAVAAEKDPVQTRVAFARALHHAGLHDFAMAAVARVLVEDSAQPEALSVRACVASCRGEFGLAEFICRGVLAHTPNCTEAWAVLARVYFDQRRWQELATCATQGLALPQAGPDARYLLLSQRAQAWLALGRLDALSADIVALRDWGTEPGTRAAAVFSALLLCRQGAFAEALAASSQLLTQPEFLGAAAELALVRFESAQRLGHPRAAGTLTERQLKRLRAAGHDVWIDRLTAEYGLAPINARRRRRSD